MPRVPQPLAQLGALVVTGLLTFGLPGSAPAQNSQLAPVIVLSSPEVTIHRSVIESLRTTLEKKGLQIPKPIADPGQALAATGPLTKAGASPIVFSVGESSTRWVLQHTQKLPVVACMVSESGPAKTATNATGVTSSFRPSEEFKLLRKLLPNARRIAVVFNPAENGAKVQAATKAAQEFGLQLVPFPVESPQQIPDALSAALEQADALWGIRDRMVLSPRTAEAFLVESFRKRVPLIGPSLEWVRAGALYAMDVDLTDIGIQCAEIALQILEGTHPHEIPLTTARRHLYALNLHTANHMEIRFSPDVVRDAAFTIAPKGDDATGEAK